MTFRRLWWSRSPGEEPGPCGSNRVPMDSLKRRGPSAFPALRAILAAALFPVGLLGQTVDRPSSLTLTDAMALALDAHPAVGQARASVDVAEARVKQARAAWFPTVATQGSLARYQEPMVVAPLHGFDPTRPPTFDQSLVRGSLSLGYTLFDGGARGARIEQAEAGERAAAAGGYGSEMVVLVQVGAAYLGILSGQELLEAVENQNQALEAEVARVGQFLEEGKAARVDLLRVEAALSRVGANEISARAGLELAQGRLARLTGLRVADVTTMDLASVRMNASVPDARDAVVVDALMSSPTLALAREQLLGAEAGVREAKAAWLPRIVAQGLYSDFGTADGGHTQEWQGAVQISYPLFTGGARKGNRERAVAEERRASEALRSAQLGAEDQAEAALAAVREAEGLREAFQLAADQSEEVARIEALALEAGAGTQTDYLSAQAELFQARAASAQAKHGEILARMELARIQGELTLTWIEENTEVVR